MTNINQTRFFYGRLMIWVFLLLISTSCYANIATSPTDNITIKKTPSPKTVLIDAEYIAFTRDEMIQQADYIFAGKVAKISTTHWNQDSGEYWETVVPSELWADVIKEPVGDSTYSAWPIYDIQFTITQPIVGEINRDEVVTLTNLGQSPVDRDDTAITNSSGETIHVETHSTYDFAVGDEMIVFALEGPITWFDPTRPAQLVFAPDGSFYADIGTRTVINFMGMPSNAYFLKRGDGLYDSPEGATEKQEPISLDALMIEIAQKRPATTQP